MGTVRRDEDDIGDRERDGGADDTAEVRSVWQGLDLPGLVDVHTHFMPQRLLARVQAYFDAAGPLIGRPWPIRYRQDEDERLAILRGYGVLTFSSLVYPHKAGMSAALNGWAAEFAARTPDCLHTATFFPEPEAGAYVAEAVESGARLFKAHIQVGAYDPADPLLDPVWGVLADSGTPVIVHCGSGPVATPFTGPGPMERVLARHPALRPIIAHLGMPEYSEFLDLAERHPSVLLDTTMAFTDFFGGLSAVPEAQIKRLADFQDRVLFGSDFPNIPYDYRHALDALTRLGLGEDWLRAVFHGNAARIFGRPVNPGAPDRS
jgi:predicted TIM-barrel fold metal-dependent hydrolase